MFNAVNGLPEGIKMISQDVIYRHTQTDRALFIPLVTPISSLHTHNMQKK